MSDITVANDALKFIGAMAIDPGTSGYAVACVRWVGDDKAKVTDVSNYYVDYINVLNLNTNGTDDTNLAGRLGELLVEGDGRTAQYFRDPRYVKVVENQNGANMGEWKRLFFLIKMGMIAGATAGMALAMGNEFRYMAKKEKWHWSLDSAKKSITKAFNDAHPHSVPIRGSPKWLRINFIKEMLPRQQGGRAMLVRLEALGTTLQAKAVEDASDAILIAMRWVRDMVLWTRRVKASARKTGLVLTPFTAAPLVGEEAEGPDDDDDDDEGGDGDGADDLSDDDEEEDERGSGSRSRRPPRALSSSLSLSSSSLSSTTTAPGTTTAAAALLTHRGTDATEAPIIQPLACPPKTVHVTVPLSCATATMSSSSSSSTTASLPAPVSGIKRPKDDSDTEDEKPTKRVKLVTSGADVLAANEIEHWRRQVRREATSSARAKAKAKADEDTDNDEDPTSDYDEKKHGRKDSDDDDEDDSDESDDDANKKKRSRHHKHKHEKKHHRHHAGKEKGEKKNKEKKTKTKKKQTTDEEASGDEKPAKRKRQPRDPDMPKLPPTAYKFWSEKLNAAFKKAHEGEVGFNVKKESRARFDEAEKASKLASTALTEDQKKMVAEYKVACEAQAVANEKFLAAMKTYSEKKGIPVPKRLVSKYSPHSIAMTTSGDGEGEADEDDTAPITSKPPATDTKGGCKDKDDENDDIDEHRRPDSESK